MTYPYISTAMNNLLFYKKDTATLIGDESNQHSYGFKLTADESKFENNTAEYLANTYGEVKSKEHAEFIVKLAEVAKGKNFTVINLDEARSFVFDSEGCLKFYKSNVNDIVTSNLKQITIPLPPESESVDDGRKPLKVLSSGRVYTFNEVTEYYDYNIAELGYIEGKTLETLKEADDYEVISFIGDDEWPKVGEIVLTASKSKAKVLATYNKKAWVEYVSGSEGFNTLNIASLSKPKTPEQELRDELSDLAFNQFNDDSYDLTHNSYYLAEQFISKYNITKKP